MAAKEPLFEGSVSDLLKEWWQTNLDNGGHWLDKGTKKIVVYPAARPWDHLVEAEQEKQREHNKSNSHA